MEELQSGTCNRDVNCPEGDDWCKQKYSVAIINAPMYYNNWGWCSGSLLNNTNNNYIPYFLTTFHCLDQDISNSILSQTEMDNVSDWSFRFGFFREGCNSGVVMPFFDYSGADFISAWNTTDFALLRLEVQPQSGEYNFSDVYYNGWDRNEDLPNSVTGLHHPNGDLMKISVSMESHGIVDNDTHWDVDWTSGTTEGGSSGSPLYNNYQRVIGQVHYGIYPPRSSDPCHPDKRTTYGMLSVSWEGGGTPETRLRDWLDPDNTGVETLDGIKMPLLKYGWQVLNGQNFTRYAYDVFKLGSNQSAPFVVNNGANLTLKAGREIVIRPCSKILNGSTFIATIDNISCSDLVYLSENEGTYGGNICNTFPPKASIDNREFDIPSLSTLIITPNPFNDKAKVTINLTNNEEVSLSLFDLLGNKIITLEDQSLLSQGTHDYTITSTNLNSGMYYIVFTTKNESITQKLILVK